MPPNPPNKRVTSPRAAWREAPCKYPHFSKNILNPPPRNEILNTPLYNTHPPVYKCKRRVEEATLDVTQSYLIAQCNKRMDGVHLLDRLLSLYRPTILGKNGIGHCLQSC